ncbi:MAG: MFS transporter [Streptosporangiales bacterium]|nr:MFS transporter [Streptosporangiales bacterium]
MTDHAPPDGQHGRDTNRRRARTAMTGAWLAFYVDLFDIYLPIVALAPAMAYFVPETMSEGGTALTTGAIFAATLLGRPVGAFLFGRLADTVGRRRTTLIAVGGAGVLTLLMAALPGYQVVGALAPAMFVLLRFVGGIFLGGEYTAANPLAMESAPKHKRGLYGGLINSGFPLANASVSLITLFLLWVVPAGAVGSPYVQWGWRIPFVLGALLSFGLVWYYRHSVTESEIFRTAKTTKTPIKTLFSRGNLPSFLQVFLLMSGFWLSLQPASAALPALLGGSVGGLSSTQTSLVLACSFLLLAPAQVASGVLSQKIGRRRFMIAAGVTITVGAAIAHIALVRLAATGPGAAFALTAALIILVIGPWGVLPSYINERFRTGVRASGYGLAYSTAVILPSFYAFYQAGLAITMPFEYTGVVLVVVGGLLVLVGGALGPETRDVDMSDPQLNAPTETAAFHALTTDPPLQRDLRPRRRC